ncbi:MAG: tRNA dihydrouridine(20/20a) synthase DusA [Gammaproteobacteria bacterium]
MRAKYRILFAPMMDLTDRHCRYFMRLLSPGVRLYTEMIPSAALVHGDPARLLEFDPAEHPVALQLGGSDPRELAAAARLGESAGYDEINLNIGCPSDRVQSGRFGACLMAEPERVADCVAAMSGAVRLPVTVKCRIGIDAEDSFEFLLRFVATVAEAGCSVFIVHARKAILSGLSPKQNREVPPLVYDRVYRLKAELPELTIVINGGIADAAQAAGHLERVDGVMLGREAYNNPYLLCALQARFFAGADWIAPSREEVLMNFLPYVRAQLREGARLHHMTRHVLGLYAGQRGARRWRRFISERSHEPGAGCDVLSDSLSLFEASELIPAYESASGAASSSASSGSGSIRPKSRGATAAR